MLSIILPTLFIITPILVGGALVLNGAGYYEPKKPMIRLGYGVIGIMIIVSIFLPWPTDLVGPCFGALCLGLIGLLQYAIRLDIAQEKRQVCHCK